MYTPSPSQLLLFLSWHTPSDWLGTPTPPFHTFVSAVLLVFCAVPTPPPTPLRGPHPLGLTASRSMMAVLDVSTSCTQFPLCSHNDCVTTSAHHRLAPHGLRAELSTFSAFLSAIPSHKPCGCPPFVTLTALPVRTVFLSTRFLHGSREHTNREQKQKHTPHTLLWCRPHASLTAPFLYASFSE